MPTEAPAAPAVAPAPTPAPSPNAAPSSPLPSKPKTAAMFSELRKAANVPSPAPAKDPAPEPKAEPEKPVPHTDVSGDAEEEPTPEPKTAEPGDKPKAKVNPWKERDKWRDEAKLSQEKLSTLESKIKEAEAAQERLLAIEARNKELEDEIRFVDYQKSEEFQKNHTIPLQKAFKTAMADLSELTFEDGGTERAIKAEDILELVNMPLAKAKEIAKDRFGEFEQDVMTHRKEIKRLFDAQAEALNEAKTKGSERERQKHEQQQQTQTALQKEISESWQKIVNDEIVKDPAVGEFFSEVEGDEEVNSRLKKGFALVDEAVKRSPADPSLTKEQRQDILRKQAAVRYRAAAFGRLVYQLKKSQSEMESLKKELSGYKSSEPGLGGGRKETSETRPAGTAHDRFKASFEELKRKAAQG